MGLAFREHHSCQVALILHVHVLTSGLCVQGSPGFVCRTFTVTGGDSSNKGCFGRKTNLFRESGDFAGNRETWENFREI